MSDREHARALLELARKDLKAMEAMALDPDSFDDAHFGFQAQQAVEKSLKAWIAYLGKEYAKTHDLQNLLDTLAGAGQRVADLAVLVDLNDFAVQYRYETIAAADVPIDRSSTLAQVQSLVDRIADLLKP